MSFHTGILHLQHTDLQHTEFISHWDCSGPARRRGVKGVVGRVCRSLFYLTGVCAEPVDQESLAALHGVETCLVRLFICCFCFRFVLMSVDILHKSHFGFLHKSHFGF